MAFECAAVFFGSLKCGARLRLARQDTTHPVLCFQELGAWHVSNRLRLAAFGSSLFIECRRSMDPRGHGSPQPSKKLNFPSFAAPPFTPDPMLGGPTLPVARQSAHTTSLLFNIGLGARGADRRSFATLDINGLRRKGLRKKKKTPVVSALF